MGVTWPTKRFGGAGLRDPRRRKLLRHFSSISSAHSVSPYAFFFRCSRLRPTTTHHSGWLPSLSPPRRQPWPTAEPPGPNAGAGWMHPSPLAIPYRTALPSTLRDSRARWPRTPLRSTTWTGGAHCCSTRCSTRRPARTMISFSGFQTGPVPALSSPSAGPIGCTATPLWRDALPPSSTALPATAPLKRHVPLQDTRLDWKTHLWGRAPPLGVPRKPRMDGSGKDGNDAARPSSATARSPLRAVQHYAEFLRSFPSTCPAACPDALSPLPDSRCFLRFVCPFGSSPLHRPPLSRTGPGCTASTTIRCTFSSAPLCSRSGALATRVLV